MQLPFFFSCSGAHRHLPSFPTRRSSDLYPVYQLGWFPDYSDADTYLTPFFLPDNFLVNHYEDDEVTELVQAQATTEDQEERAALIEEVQAAVAEDLPTLPFLQGAQVAVDRKSVV